MRWDPFRDMERFWEEEWPRLPVPKIGWDMAVDVYEENNNVVAEMNIPGIDPENIEVSIEDNHLRISGEREEKQEKQEKQYHSKEIRRGSFERIVRLPAEVKTSEVDAEYKDGVLKVTMPKKEPEKGEKKRIQIRR